ncbi:helix-turn-helix transcriptional regulator [Streptomyces sp. AM 2-1-1]|uniref:helix-turn-helix domain-containing protein n=1 Tax=Streptomyces sp. AM 2-1-1 TaxID=3028709 RepID=UPI0023B98A27|nr:helix-turn-helix transcriptional regulator [Streptomyces sp. AM 2-1-1]WEH39967.1 helix-turn-helix transcriptional regulator [Streptomyces sp. AM 2-1-1]
MTIRARDTSPYATGHRTAGPSAPRLSAPGPAAPGPAASGPAGGARVIPLRPFPATPGPVPQPSREPLLRDLVGAILHRERLAQRRTLKDVADAARISFGYLSELERGRKEASSEVLAAASHALGLRLADVLGRAAAELARPAGFHPVTRSPGGDAPRAQVRLAA